MRSLSHADTPQSASGLVSHLTPIGLCGVDAPSLGLCLIIKADIREDFACPSMARPGRTWPFLQDPTVAVSPNSKAFRNSQLRQLSHPSQILTVSGHRWNIFQRHWSSIGHPDPWQLLFFFLDGPSTHRVLEPTASVRVRRFLALSMKPLHGLDSLLHCGNFGVAGQGNSGQELEQPREI